MLQIRDRSRLEGNTITSGDILIEGFDQVGLAGDGHESVGHVLTLEEGL